MACKNDDMLCMYSPSAQDTNWYHLGGGGQVLLCFSVTHNIMSLKLEKKHDGLLWGVAIIF